MPSEIVSQIFDGLDVEELLPLGFENYFLLDNIYADSWIKSLDPVDVIIKNSSPDNGPISLSLWSIRISDPLSVFRFLRLFGKRVKTLQFMCDEFFSELVYRIFCYINRYCINLNSLYISDLKFSIGRSLKKKPFKHVIGLRFTESKICCRLNEIGKWFPNVSTLFFRGKNDIEHMFLIK